MSTPIILLISAPSGAGKTTVCNALLAANPNLRRVVTSTTRPARPGERHGVDYHFFSPEEFARRREADEFLEHASVYDRAYGTLKSSVLDLLAAGHDVLLNIDVQGAASVRRVAAGDPVLKGALATVFLTPPTLAELEARLRGRGADPEDVIARRLAEAGGEAGRWAEFDYLVVSTTRAEDSRRMQAIYDTERLRSARAEFRLGV
ncbi:MAG TPA: guanylate kinase [Candidatus Limnocylindria bacterium]|jgi:guanylate kinase|nr:guanylate kinase [Candidatus Limnocylindria bacterium]